MVWGGEVTTCGSKRLRGLCPSWERHLRAVEGTAAGVGCCLSSPLASDVMAIKLRRAHWTRHWPGGIFGEFQRTEAGSSQAWPEGHTVAAERSAPGAGRAGARQV